MRFAVFLYRPLKLSSFVVTERSLKVRKRFEKSSHVRFVIFQLKPTE